MFSNQNENLTTMSEEFSIIQELIQGLSKQFTATLANMFEIIELNEGQKKEKIQVLKVLTLPTRNFLLKLNIDLCQLPNIFHPLPTLTKADSPEFAN